MRDSLMIYFENSQKSVEITYKLKKLIRLSVQATLAFEGYRNSCEVSVTFTDDAGIRELNKNFRNIDSATDVLSFPLFDYEGSEEPAVDELENMLGDIVISLERAKAQAEEYGHSFEREVAFLCVHSMLHLLGYDHVNGGLEAVRMREKEEYVLTQIGLPRSNSYIE